VFFFKAMDGGGHDRTRGGSRPYPRRRRCDFYLEARLVVHEDEIRLRAQAQGKLVPRDDVGVGGFGYEGLEEGDPADSAVPAGAHWNSRRIGRTFCFQTGGAPRCFVLTSRLASVPNYREGEMEVVNDSRAGKKEVVNVFGACYALK
jgi:hypothetical protein